MGVPTTEHSNPIALLLALALVLGCSHVNEPDEPEGDAGADTDSDSDSDSDGDADSECVVDTETCTNGFLDVIGYEIETAEDIAALEGYTGIGNTDEWYGEFVIAGTSLTDLHGLECLTWIGGGLEIYDNPLLGSLAGLCGVTSVGNQLILDNNAALDSLHGLDNLAAVCATALSESGGIQIHNNDTLEDLSALGGLTDFPCTHLYVKNNPQLPTCEAENLLDHLYAQGWDGTAQIEGNDDDGTCEE